MTVTDQTQQTVLRASSLRDCPRKAVLEATTDADRPRTPREERWLYRGKSVGRDYLIFLASSHGWKIAVDSGPEWWVPPDLLTDRAADAGIVAEKRIKWGHGYGHADGWIAETRSIVECLSSANPSEELVRSKMLQCVLYVEHDPDSDLGAVVIVDPSDFTEERIVLSPSSATYRALVEEMRERIAEVDVWKQTGALPGRVCRKPSDARQHFCRHAITCFEGWEPPPLEVVAADEDLMAAVAEFDEVKRARADKGAEDKALEARQKEAQAVIEAAELPAGVDVKVGPFVVRRTAVERKPTFAWEKAELAGVFEPGLYGDYFKPGASYSTYRAERVDVSGDEYGDEVPF